MYICVNHEGSFRGCLKIGKYKLSEIFKNLIDPYYFKIDAFIEANILHDYMKLFGDSNINNIRHLIINLTQSIKYRTVKHLYTIPDDKHGYQLKKEIQCNIILIVVWIIIVSIMIMLYVSYTANLKLPKITQVT